MENARKVHLCALCLGKRQMVLSATLTCKKENKKQTISCVKCDKWNGMGGEALGAYEVERKPTK